MQSADHTTSCLPTPVVEERDYRAIAVLGVRIHKDDLVTQRRRKAFEHSHPPDWSFDPTSGTPLWVVEDEPVLSDEFLARDDFHDICAFSEGVDGDHLIIGIGVSTDSSLLRAAAGEAVRAPFDVSRRDNIDWIRDALGELLGDRYYDCDFGLWSVQYCSY